MPSIYLSQEIVVDDPPETRRQKLYLRTISIGEELYCLGAAVNEMVKKLNALEGLVMDVRKELAAIKQAESTTSQEGKSGNL